MKNAVIIHGAYGDPDQNWFPWLRQQLELHHYAVEIPQFPTPQGQLLNEWLDVFSPYLSHINHETVLIGHSIGATFILSLLEELSDSIRPRGVYLIAGFAQDLPDEDLNVINRSFYRKNFYWEKIKRNNLNLYYSPDDPFVPTQTAQHLSKILDSPLKIIPGAGHFNSKSGYNTFTQLLTDILESERSEVAK